jgi:predicted MFS family arabinose efflux permease
MSAGDLSGVIAPFTGRFVDRHARRSTMIAGMGAIATMAALASAAPGVIVFAIALIGLSMSKSLFDSSMGAWIGDRTEYRLRAQVLSLTETSWALSLLVGIPVLGLITAATSWRVAFALIATANLALALVLRARLEVGEHMHHADSPRQRGLFRASWPAYLGVGFLMTGATCLFVTYGPWFEDSFGFSTVTIAVTSILIGAVELLASTSSIGLTDRLGKRRSTMAGAALMVPGGLIATVVGSNAPLGIFALAVFFLGFEFAVVSALPLIGELRPGARASSIGIAVGCGTVGRGIAAIVATRLYTVHGIGGAAAVAVGCALGVIACFGAGVTEPAH